MFIFRESLIQYLRKSKQYHITNRCSLGSINDFAVSGETLKKMYSTEYVDAMRSEFREMLKRLALAPPESV